MGDSSRRERVANDRGRNKQWIRLIPVNGVALTRSMNPKDARILAA